MLKSFWSSDYILTSKDKHLKTIEIQTFPWFSIPTFHNHVSESPFCSLFLRHIFKLDQRLGSIFFLFLLNFQTYFRVSYVQINSSINSNRSSLHYDMPFHIILNCYTIIHETQGSSYKSSNEEKHIMKAAILVEQMQQRGSLPTSLDVTVDMQAFWESNLTPQC